MDRRIFLAPLEGVTDRCFRSCFYDHFPGLSGALTPFLPIPDRVKKIPRRILDEVALPGKSKVPEIPQLLVSELSAFMLSLRVLEDAGYRDLNWNLGCPSRGVVRKGKGAGMMPRTGEILGILDKVIPASGLKISLKLRMGMYEDNELFRLLSEIKHYPVDLILHPRLGTQIYGGKVDIEGFRKALDLYGKPLCYNGDIGRAADLNRLHILFPEVEEWMIGRGLLADPFLLEDISEETEGLSDLPALARDRFWTFLDDLMQRMRAHFSSEAAYWGYMKGILSYSFHDKRVKPEYFSALKKLKNEEEWNLLRERIGTGG